MNHNAMQGIGDWSLELETISISNRTAFCYEVFCRLAKLIQVNSAKLQRFQLAFKHLLLLEKNSRLHPFFWPLISILFPGLEKKLANFQTFSRIQDFVRTLQRPIWRIPNDPDDGAYLCPRYHKVLLRTPEIPVSE